MILDSPNRWVEAVLAANVTTTPLSVVAQWSDTDQFTNPLFTQQLPTTLGTTTGHPAVTIIPAPPGGNWRKVRHVTVCNLDSVSATVTVRLNFDGTAYTLFKITLKAGYKLEWEDGSPVVVRDGNGAVQ